jgi:glucose-1-phosphate adenylyltransferase
MVYKENSKEINVASIILAGGKGTRLFPLTSNHSKPAMAFGGRYRLIDIPISNSLNSNIRQIFVIGQYLTAELQHHLSQTYQFDNFLPGRLDFLTPEELPNGERIWFEGTADAIRKCITKIEKIDVDYFLILSGDQLYNINFHKMLEFAQKTDADLTIATLPVKEKEAKRMGIMKIDATSQINDFIEKPQEEKILTKFRMPAPFYKKWNIADQDKKYLGSMGIYIFKRDALLNLLKKDAREDFGKHLIPTAIKEDSKVFSFVYDGYWEDIGTIASFYEANMELTKSEENVKLNTYDENSPIYTRAYNLPGSKLYNTKIHNSLICEGCVIEAKSIENCVIGIRSKIKKGCLIKDSILLGNSTCKQSKHHKHFLPDKFEIDENAHIEKAIIDEGVNIGKNVKLINKNNLLKYDGDNGVYVRDGIIIVTSGTNLPDNYIF